MGGERRPADEPNPLDERKEEILREIVEAYIRGGDPVGSKVVADRSDLGVSSATVRNEMGILEREGYISHPHTSAGRVPTDKGYRYYVDVLAPRVRTDPGQRREIERFLAGAFTALDDLLERASQILADLTDYTSLASPPLLGLSTLSRLELVRLGGTRLLVVCVGEQGWHEDRVVELPSEISDADLRRSIDIANSVVGGRTMAEAAVALRELAAPAGAETLLSSLVEALHTTAREQGRMVTGGASRIVTWEPADTAQRVLEMLEVGGIQMPDPDIDGVTVRIGEELALRDLRDLSLIATGYRFGRESGTLGVLGPTRMDYPVVISTVAAVASTVSKILGRLGP